MDMAVEMPEIWPVVERIRTDGRLTGIYPASTVGLVLGSRPASRIRSQYSSRGRSGIIL